MDAYISQFTSKQIDEGIDISFNVIKLIALITSYGYDVSTITSTEWLYVILDNENKVLAGIRVDNSVFVADL